MKDEIERITLTLFLCAFTEPKLFSLENLKRSGIITIPNNYILFLIVQLAKVPKQKQMGT